MVKNRFIINHDLSGYTRVEIDDTRLLDCNNIVVLILNDGTSTALHSYYNQVREIILSGAKLICICIGKESKIRKAIMMLMTLYKSYNIYRVESIDIVDDEYIAALEEREPDLTEVQQYIGGDMAAYSEINTILFGISNLVNTGDLEGLKVFIEQHVESLESSIEVIEYLRKSTDNANSGELNSIINILKSKLSENTKEVANLNAEVKQYKLDNDKLNDRVQTLSKDLQRVNRKAADLEDQLSSVGDSSAVISTYRELNTSLIRCKTQNILYFKEISYVRYTNSLINNLFLLLKNVYKDRIKLLIYDNRVGIPGLYKGLSIINTNEYLSNKSKIIKTTTKMVVPEPNPVFLDDILTSINPQFDVVIVYDRLRQPPDLVCGNNVTRTFIVNSASNLSAAKESIRVSPNNLIITNDSKIPGSLQIGSIPDYSNSTESARIAKYARLPASAGSSDKLINAILTKARININGGV